MTINWGVDEQIIVHSYNDMLLKSEKDKTTDTCNKVENTSRWKNLKSMMPIKLAGAKRFLLYSSIYMTSYKRQNDRDRK